MNTPDSKRIRLSRDLTINDKSENSTIIKLPFDQCYKRFNEMRKNNELCDVKLKLQNGSEIWAHKIVLAANSDYFNVMFNSGFKESKESEIVIQDLDPHIMSLLIEFMYTSKLVVTEQNFQEILNGICLLQLDELICHECVKFIKTIIDSTNCLGLKELAECLGLSYFYSFCFSYTLENYKSVIENEEFMLISFDQILQIIQNENLCTNEEIVYKSVIKWIKYDSKNRSKYLPELLEHVRLPLVSPMFLKLVDAEPLLKLENDCMKYLTEAYTFQTLYGTGLEASKSVRTQYRPNYSECILILSRSGRSHLPLSFNLISHEWKTIPTILPHSNGGLIYMLCDGRILDLGGLLTNVPDFGVNDYFSYREYNNVVQEMRSARIYDIGANQWIPLHPMHEPHNDTNIVQIDCRVYVVGYLRSEYYNIPLDKWFRMNSLKSPRTKFEVVALNGLIYAVGGKNRESEMNVVEKFEPLNDIWTFVAPMIHSRVSPTLCAFKGCIYAIGGLECPNKYLNTVEKYDPNSDTWEEVANLNFSRYMAGAVSVNGSIFVFGGVNSNYTIEVYCPYKNKWSVLSIKIPNSLGCNSMCYAFIVDQAIQHKFD